MFVCANRMTGRSIDAWSNKRTQELQKSTQERSADPLSNWATCPQDRGADQTLRSPRSYLLLLFGCHNLSNTTCLIRPHLVYALCVFRRVKDHHHLLHDSPLLKNTCLRQVVIDKWFPLTYARCFLRNPQAPSPASGLMSTVPLTPAQFRNLRRGRSHSKTSDYELYTCLDGVDQIWVWEMTTSHKVKAQMVTARVSNPT